MFVSESSCEKTCAEFDGVFCAELVSVPQHPRRWHRVSDVRRYMSVFVGYKKKMGGVHALLQYVISSFRDCTCQWNPVVV